MITTGCIMIRLKDTRVQIQSRGCPFGRGGVLTLGTRIGRAPTKMLFQQDGNALVTAGGFQAEFCHGVLARNLEDFDGVFHVCCIGDLGEKGPSGGDFRA